MGMGALVRYSQVLLYLSWTRLREIRLKIPFEIYLITQNVIRNNQTTSATLNDIYT